MRALVDNVASRPTGGTEEPASAPALRRLLADGLVRSDAAGNLTAIAPEEAREHLDRSWNRVLDVDALNQTALQRTA
jgi:hypothetical protein